LKCSNYHCDYSRISREASSHFCYFRTREARRWLRKFAVSVSREFIVSNFVTKISLAGSKLAPGWQQVAFKTGHAWAKIVILDSTWEFSNELSKGWKLNALLTFCTYARSQQYNGTYGVLFLFRLFGWLESRTGVLTNRENCNMEGCGALYEARGWNCWPFYDFGTKNDFQMNEVGAKLAAGCPKMVSQVADLRNQAWSMEPWWSSQVWGGKACWSSSGDVISDVNSNIIILHHIGDILRHVVVKMSTKSVKPTASITQPNCHIPFWFWFCFLGVLVLAQFFTAKNFSNLYMPQPIFRVGESFWYGSRWMRVWILCTSQKRSISLRRDLLFCNLKAWFLDLFFPISLTMRRQDLSVCLTLDEAHEFPIFFMFITSNVMTDLNPLCFTLWLFDYFTWTGAPQNLFLLSPWKHRR